MGKKKEALGQIVGIENILDDRETLHSYGKDHSFVLPMRPSMVVKVDKGEKVEEIVKWANMTETPLVPVSSGPPHFRGDTVPSIPGAVVLDLNPMKNIIMIDRRNKIAVFEPGVTYSQLLPELAREGLTLSSSLAPRQNKSVLASLVEREPRMIPRNQWAFHEPLRCLELILPDGQKVRTGDAGNLGDLEEARKKHHLPISSSGPYQIDGHKIVSAAQGSMGIATWASAKCDILPKIHKLFFVTSKRVEELIDFVYRILRFRFADELMILNNSYLASMIGNSHDEIDNLRRRLPLWVVLVGVAGRSIMPEERVEFQEKDISDIAQQFGLQLVPEIPGARNSEVSNLLKNPSREPYWKCIYKGDFQDIFFLTTLNKTPEFIKTVYSLAEVAGYASSDIGVYLQPIHQGTACHCEFNFPYDSSNQEEKSNVREFFNSTSLELLNHGAFYSRPYGIWADMAYNRDAQTTIVLKGLKQIFDPNCVMNPGKLCF